MNPTPNSHALAKSRRPSSRPLSSRVHVSRLASSCLALSMLAIALPGARADEARADPAASAAAAEQRSTLDDQQAVAVTIYNGGLALVKDTRSVELHRGLGRLALRDVSAQMRPETAQLRGLSHPGSFEVLEQNFDFDLLTPAALLGKAVGQTVRVVRTVAATGAETVETAQVLSAQDGVVLKIGDRIETGLPGRIVFDRIPATLSRLFTGQNLGKQLLELD